MDTPFDYCRIFKLTTMFTDDQKSKMQKKLDDIKCPICGKDYKLITDVPTHVISFPETSTGYDFTKVSYITCVCVECLSCGYLMQFKVDTLLK